MRTFRTWLKQLTKSKKRPIVRRTRLELAPLEDRLVPSTFTVLNTNDAGVGSFRQAMESANKNPGFDTIQFKIQNLGVGVVHVKSPLPVLFDRVAIDGTTQPGFKGKPIITLDGGQAGADVDGLTFTANQCSLQGLIIGNFDGSGVVMQSDGNLVKNCFVGINAFANPMPNNQDGVLILGQNNIVGGTSAQARNVISGNALDGISIQGKGVPFVPSPNRIPDNNQVEGNYIGTDLDGSFSVANGFNGVEVTGSNSNVIGGLAAGAGNLISGNALAGVAIHDPGTGGNKIQANLVGTDYTGKFAIPNLTGIFLSDGASYNGVGSNAAAGRNLISGNVQNGILISGSQTTNNTVVGNYIGTDQKGATALANNADGVEIVLGAMLNTVGGTGDGARNIISGNGKDGVLISSSGTSSNTVAGNFIGIDQKGLTALANQTNGVEITDGATLNTVGGTTAAARNVISGNTNDGVLISGRETTLNAVQGNFIGADKTGAAALPNVVGVELLGNSSHNYVGGDVAGAGNVISGNTDAGVYLNVGTNNTFIEGNLIGTDSKGTAALGNNRCGVVLDDYNASNQIGGTSAQARNVISGNQIYGIDIFGRHTQENVIEGNYIGTNKNGTAALGNVIAGVFVEDGAFHNVIGGHVAGSRNVISGNEGNGVTLSGFETTDNVVDGNYIGTDKTGKVALANYNGVVVEDSPGNTIGGDRPSREGTGRNVGLGNLISGNQEVGVVLAGTGAANNFVIGNFIGTDAAGKSAIPNFNGVNLQSGANNNSIGYQIAGSGNLISGNKNDGVNITFDGETSHDVPGTSNNNLLSNYIGTDRSGKKALGNGHDGVSIGKGAQENGVGAGDSSIGPSSLNIISGNAQAGVRIHGDKTINNYVDWCYIGTDVSGNFAIPNSVGVVVDNVAFSTSVSNSTISRNTTDGVRVTGVSANFAIILSDHIEANGHDGVYVSDGAQHTVIGGGFIYGNGDFINGNSHDGVEIAGDASSSAIEYSQIRNNGADGIAIYGGHDNRIGDQGKNAFTQEPIRIGNSIFNNGQSGIRLDNTTNNIVQANDIGGYNKSQQVDQGNGQYGIVITNGSSNNLIGAKNDPLGLLGNTIAFNKTGGVLIGSDSVNPFAPEAGTGNTVLRDLIFANGANNNVSGIHLGWAGAQTANDLGDGDTGANNLQNKPILSAATSSPFSTSVFGFFNSVPNANFRLEFFLTDANEQSMSFLKAVDVQSSGSPLAQTLFAATLPIGNLDGQQVVATLTNLDTGDTSEFSAPCTMSLLLFE